MAMMIITIIMTQVVTKYYVRAWRILGNYKYQGTFS